jgi:hypothetical protein
MTPTTKRCAVAIAILAGLGAWIGWRRSGASATPPPVPPPVTAAPALPAGPDPAAAGATVPATTAQIVFTTMPPAYATVTWGKTRLGRITPRQPLVVVRPRDSGPLDVIVRAAGFLPVHTRAHTFADTKLVVKLTPPEQKTTLLGYRAPIDAGTPLTPDGGVPPTLSGMPPSLSFAPPSPANMTPVAPDAATPMIVP